MDSNVKREEVGSVVTVSVSDDVLNNGAHFVYAAGTGTYDDWRRVFY